MSNRVGFFTLENGMTVYNRTGRMNVSGAGVKSGALDDPPGKTGLAHVTEHVLCRENRRHHDPRKIDMLFRAHMGGPDGNINIRTDRTSTFYGHQDLLRRRHMAEIFDVMAHFILPRHRIVNQNGMDVELGAVHQEYYLRGWDSMPELLDDLFHATLYRKNPVRNRIDCNLEHLQALTIQDVRLFLRQHYVPKNAFAIIFGPKPEEAKNIAERYFSDWKTKTEPTHEYDHSEDVPQFSRPRFCEMDRVGIRQYHCALGFPTETYFSKDAEAIDVLGQILEMRLTWELREGNRSFLGGAYRTPVFTERSHSHGLIYASFATVDADFAERAESAVLREFKRFAAELVSEDDLKTAVSTLHNQYCDGFWNVSNDLCEMVINAISNGDANLEHFHSFRERLARVSRRKLRAVANKYFASGNGHARALIRPA